MLPQHLKFRWSQQMKHHPTEYIVQNYSTTCTCNSIRGEILVPLRLVTESESERERERERERESNR